MTAQKKIKLGIGLPLVEYQVPVLFFKSFLLLDCPEFELLTPRFTTHPGDMARARNDLAAAALEAGCTHLLMMDTDQVYHDQDMITRLLGHDLPVVGAKVHRRWPPFEPILNRGGHHVPDAEIEAGGLVPCDTTGAGCLLINTDIFREMPAPWFETIYQANGQVDTGEDISFCKKLGAMGVKLFVDCDVNIGHLTTMQVEGNFYNLWKKLKNTTRG